LVALCSLRCMPFGGDPQFAQLSAPERRPAGLKDVDVRALVGGPEECRRRLRQLVAGEVAALRVLEEEHRTGRDRKDREQLLNRALLVHDCDTSRQFLRYHKEWCSKFFRAYQELPRTLERDAAGFFDDLAGADDLAVEAGPGIAPAIAAAAEEPVAVPGDWVP